MESEGKVEPIIKEESEKCSGDSRYKIVETSPKMRFSRVKFI